MPVSKLAEPASKLAEPASKLAEPASTWIMVSFVEDETGWGEA